jgi:hypothetical protein
VNDVIPEEEESSQFESMDDLSYSELDNPVLHSRIKLGNNLPPELQAIFSKNNQQRLLNKNKPDV